MILAEVLMSSSKPDRGEVFALPDLNPANPDNPATLTRLT
jgi:hypothetical protein